MSSLDGPSVSSLILFILFYHKSGHLPPLFLGFWRIKAKKITNVRDFCLFYENEVDLFGNMLSLAAVQNKLTGLTRRRVGLFRRVKFWGQGRHIDHLKW